MSNILSKVTLNGLLKNKTRTIVTIIGVMLSAAMICAVAVSVTSLQSFLLNNMIYKNGDWHGCALNDNKAGDMELIAKSDEVERYVSARYVGYAIAPNCQNEYKPYMYITEISENFEDMMYLKKTAGEYPKTEGEIMLPDHLNSNGGVSYNLGDVIELDIGDRMYNDEKLYQNYYGGYVDGDDGEKLVITSCKTYTVCGFYERPSFENYNAPGYTCLTAQTDTESGVYNIFFKLKNPEDIYDFMSENGLSGDTNSDVLMMLGTSKHSAFYTILYSMAAIITVLIVFGSVSLIYNAFSISVSERTKQFGLLSSVGATGKQIRHSVFFEAICISIIGIPLGILSGILGIAVTLNLLGDKFMSLSSYAEVRIGIHVTWQAILITCIVALITVFISAWIPSMRATRITSIEAIRQSKDIVSKKVKTSKLTLKLFGLPGVLAAKYFKRSKRKYRATIVSLFMSIVLFVTSSALTHYLTESVKLGFSTYTYDVRYYATPDVYSSYSIDNIYKLINSADAVKNSAKVITYTSHAVLNKSVFSERALSALRDQPGYDIESSMTGSVKLCFVEDDVYREWLETEGIDSKSVFDESAPKAILADNQVQFMDKDGKYQNMEYLSTKPIDITLYRYAPKEGFDSSGAVEDNEDGELCIRYYKDDETLLFPFAESVLAETEIHTLKAVNNNPFFSYGEGSVAAMYPLSFKDAVLADLKLDADASVIAEFYVTSSDHRVTNDDIQKKLSEAGLSTARLTDYSERAETNRNVIMIINVFSYGFIILISLIAVANVFNTISTNVALRRREFAMLRSVGMTKSGFNKMMNYECLLYGTKALLFGIPVSLLLTYIIYVSINEGMFMDFVIPWLSVAIAVLSVFAVVFVTMMYAMRKVNKENPIDALKNENM